MPGSTRPRKGATPEWPLSNEIDGGHCKRCRDSHPGLPGLECEQPNNAAVERTGWRNGDAQVDLRLERGIATTRNSGHTLGPLQTAMAIAAVQQLLSCRDRLLGMSALPREAQTKMEEVHPGGTFEMASKMPSPRGISSSTPELASKESSHQKSFPMRL